ncbi:unnamed protein product [Ixodes persulcatus]
MFAKHYGIQPWRQACKRAQLARERNLGIGQRPGHLAHQRP